MRVPRSRPRAFRLLVAVKVRDEPFWPIKGAPEDMSNETRTQFEGYGADAHSASSLTVRELLQFDWNVEMEALTDDRYLDGRAGRAAALQRLACQDRALPLELAGRPSRGSPTLTVRDHGVSISWREPFLRGRDEFARCLVFMSVWSAGDLGSVRAVFWFDN